MNLSTLRFYVRRAEMSPRESMPDAAHVVAIKLGEQLACGLRTMK